MSNSHDFSYASLKAFLIVFSNRFLNASVVPEELRPEAFLNKLEKTSPKAAEKSLRLALQDCMSLASSWSREQLKQVDRDFERAGVVTITALLPVFSKEYSKILKRGRISSDIEYFLLKGLYDDGVVPQDAIERVSKLLETYESQLDDKSQ
jgi:hypothetical protein